MPKLSGLLVLAVLTVGMLALVERGRTAGVALAERAAEPVASAPAVKPVVDLAAVEALPGGVLRWSGSDTLSCRLGERAYPPSEIGCLLAIDLAFEGTVYAWRETRDRIERLPIEIGDYPYPEQHIRLADTSRVNLSAENQRRAAEERERIVALWKRESRSRFDLPLHPPLEKMPEGGRFGSRRFYNGEPRSPHTGRDYSAPQGTPVMAAEEGVVGLAEEHFFGGNSIFVDHGGGLVTMYLHLHEMFVEPGQRVTRGAVIGSVGSTGRSTGPHLHFGIRLHGQRVDPVRLMADPEKLPEISQSIAPPGE